ncbi:MAG: hypothetical protein WAL88_06055 [Nitrosotalea sp.]
MDDYQVEFHVNTIFPSELKPQITKDIKVIQEYASIDEPDTTVVSVTTESDSFFNAIKFCRKELNQFLGFYSATTLNHPKIIPSDKIPISATRLTGSREIQEFRNFDDTTEYSDWNFNPVVFTSHILKYFPLLSNSGNEYLYVAIDYLRRARFEIADDIVILDCFIALEALFFKSSEKTELTYRLSNRVATLLGKNNEHRVKLREEISNLYDMRSRIVHGDHISLGENPFGPLLIYVREAIMRFLMLSVKYTTHNEIIKKLDDAAIDNSIRDDLRNESSELFEVIQKEILRLVEEERKRS